MDHLQVKDDLTNVKELQESTLLKRPLDILSTDKPSKERVQKRRAVDEEIEYHAEHDEVLYTSNN